MDFDGLGFCFSIGRWCCLHANSTACNHTYFCHGVNCAKVLGHTKIVKRDILEIDSDDKFMYRYDNHH